MLHVPTNDINLLLNQDGIHVHLHLSYAVELYMYVCALYIPEYIWL